ncbi:unnamed protein product [Medioppia subpectinata]|uniref:Chitin-binding type-2 domain-containing protein n=1 Tax=Medioppia subpectinata TaxID=1979941 RepID=A0A7R9LBF6_9ACAR|nr:unnamed protein product [Medioppia subpectinata]CAG2117078.1 unnamed protein product [Medioppia subpectinata]
MVTLYNPDVWPGPNDTHHSSTTTPMPPKAPRNAKFVFGLRRSGVETRNLGYGYDYNDTQPITPYPPVYTTPLTISPINRKFYDFNFNQINNNTVYNRRNITRGFRTFIPNEYGIRYRTPRPVFREYNTSQILPDFNSHNQFPDYYSSRPILRPVLRPVLNVYNNSQDFFTRDYPHISRDFPDVRNFTLQTISNQTSNTAFRCEYQRYFGYYADVGSNCRVFHVCTPDGRKASFICPNRLLFNQKLSVCDWSYNVECDQSVNFYDTNLIKFDNWNKLLFSRKK